MATDTEGRIKLMNRVAEEMAGATLAEVVGKPLQDVFILHDPVSGKPVTSAEPLAESNSLGPKPKRRQLRNAKLQSLIVEQNAALLHDREGRIIGSVYVFRNVTENHYLEQELIKANKLESLGLLAGGLAHDFNNILTAIVGNISLIRQDSQDSLISAKLQEVEAASEKARCLTHQLLTFAKGGAPIKTFTSIAELIKESTEFALRGSRIRPEFSQEANLWSVHADAGQIEQVVHNIVINAQQAMLNGGALKILLENHILESDTKLPLQPGRYVRISFEDTGAGIPESIISRVFDPYFTTKSTGHGLGLAMVYSIIKRHDGHIAVRSQEGVGSTFEIYLPAVERIAPLLKSTRAQNWKGSGCILVMDDEPSIRALLTAILAHYGFTSVAVPDGKQAIAEYIHAMSSGQPFKAVILDITVPGGMGGKETMEELLKLDPEVKAIVSSGYSTDPVLAEFSEHGFAGRIEKPYRADQIASLLKTILGC
ncbi:MAG: hybrid sensor histidine kinase/response regulator [Verrucomicrobiales bacterium]